ncbi:MAG TPA: glutamate racemase [Spirochaetia bacterium]|nr:glutamate racemase [Spirochaetia bacterium]
MNPETVAFLDSGVGGLPYLAHARGYLDGRRLVYVADREHFPYGERSRAQVIEATLDVAARLLRREKPALVVVACNTMSVVALAELRARFHVPFVGVVPAVKPAALLSRRRKVGVLATRRTVEGEYLQDLIRQHAAGCDVVCLSAGPLVEFVEKELASATPAERQAHVQAEVDRFTSEGIDALVLACTHFLHLEEEFRALLEQRDIQLVDSREGVSRQAARLLREAGAPGATARADGPDVLYVTGPRPVADSYAWFASRYGLRLGEEL